MINATLASDKGLHVEGMLSYTESRTNAYTGRKIVGAIGCSRAKVRTRNRAGWNAAYDAVVGQPRGALRRAMGTTELDAGISAALAVASAAARCSRIIFLNRFFRSVLNDGVYWNPLSVILSISAPLILRRRCAKEPSTRQWCAESAEKSVR